MIVHLRFCVDRTFGARPRLLHQDTSILQYCSDFIDDNLHLDQQTAVPSPHCDVTFDPVVGEAGEGERAVGSYIIT